MLLSFSCSCLACRTRLDGETHHTRSPAKFPLIHFDLAHGLLPDRLLL